MRITGRRLTLLVASLALTLGLSLTVWSGSANQHVSPQEANKQEKTPQDDVPVLDLKQAEKDGSDQLKGRKRGQRLYQDRQIAELPAGVGPLPSSAHFWLHMPALPIEQSNAIVLGKIVDRRAVLLEDRRGIYSEFSVKITEIFKDDLGGLFIDQVITVARPGGAVLFPSGKIQTYTISSMGFPQQDKVYALFLKRDAGGDYSILTGYEVIGDVVEPLDGRRDLPKNQPYNQFDVFRGSNLESFRDALQKAIQHAVGERP
jgi:hypothetical protein